MTRACNTWSGTRTHRNAGKAHALFWSTTLTHNAHELSTRITRAPHTHTNSYTHNTRKHQTHAPYECIDTRTQRDHIHITHTPTHVEHTGTTYTNTHIRHKHYTYSQYTHTHNTHVHHTHTHANNRKINEDLGVPFFADHIRALSEIFDSELADAGTPWFGNSADICAHRGLTWPIQSESLGCWRLQSVVAAKAARSTIRRVTSWHFSSNVTEAFPRFFLSCTANARV
jgi:hypothetical protein